MDETNYKKIAKFLSRKGGSGCCLCGSYKWGIIDQCLDFQNDEGKIQVIPLICKDCGSATFICKTIIEQLIEQSDD